MINFTFRFNEFSRDLNDLMATLEHDFRKQDTYLAKDWYSKIVSIVTKRGAIDCVTPSALPQFLKGITTIISLEVFKIEYYLIIVKHFFMCIKHLKILISKCIVIINCSYNLKLKSCAIIMIDAV